MSRWIEMTKRKSEKCIVIGGMTPIIYSKIKKSVARQISKSKKESRRKKFMIRNSFSWGPEIHNYAEDVEYRKTKSEINKLKKQWKNSGMYTDIKILKTIKPKGFAIYGSKKVRPFYI